MLSADAKQLETLRTITQFLEVIKDPAALQKTLKESQETAARLEAAVKAHSSVEKAQEYLYKAEATLKDAQEAAAKLKGEAQQLKLKALTDAKAETEALQEKQSLLAKQRETLAEEQAELAKAQAAVKAVKAEQTGLQERLTLQERSLREREQSLIARAKKMQELAA